MDTVILAAGENVRLQAAGIPPGKKPLMYREGEVLIRRLARQAMVDNEDSHPGRLIIVANPSNAEEVAYATAPYDPYIILQLKPEGPVAAVNLALELTQSNRIMLLMGDNFIHHWHKNHGAVPTVSVELSNDDALHAITDDGYFTTSNSSLIRWLGPVTFHKDMWNPDSKTWVEAFENIEFHLVQHPGNVEDMGVIK